MLEEFTMMTDLLRCSDTRLLEKANDDTASVIIRGFLCSVSNASVDRRGKVYKHLELWKCMLLHIWFKKERTPFPLQDKFILCF